MISEPSKPSNAHLVQRIKLIRGDIVKQDVDAIVTTIPKTLEIEGKLNSDILNTAGPALDEYILEKVYKPKVGEIFSTPGFGLAAQNVIFSVTAAWRTEFDRTDRDLLHVYRESTKQALKMGLHSVAFPSLITGRKGFPIIRAARLALQGIMDQMSEQLIDVRIVCYNAEAEVHYRDRLERMGWMG